MEMPHIPPQVKFPANNDKVLGQIGGADRASNMRDGGEDAREFIGPDHRGTNRHHCKPPIGGIPGPAPRIDLTALNGADGYSINGIAPGGGLGAAVTGAGDLNGDGYADVLIGAPGATRNGIASGEAYIVFGHGKHFNSSLDLAALGEGGVVLTDSAARSASGLGSAVAGLGDVNGDGISDISVGSPGEIRRFITPDQTLGKAHVLYGAADFGSTHTIDLAGLTGNNGFSVAFEPAGESQGLGIAVAGGDVNGDGVGDVLVSAETSPNDLFPSINVLFGSPNLGDGGNVDPTAPDAPDGFRILASQILTSTFVSLSPAVGDFTGDSIADIAAGQFSSNGPSVTFGAEVIMGGPGIAAGGDIHFGAALPGSFNFTVDAFANNATTGVIASAGDVNGDGIDDLIVGIGPKSYVIFGGTGVKPNTTLDASQLDGHNGFVINGGGTAVSAAGDFNGDGIADLLIAGPNDSYIVFGGKGIGASGSLDLTTLDRGAGVTLAGKATAVAAAGDVNGDGLSDVILGNPAAGAAGQAYVVFGTDKYNAPSSSSTAIHSEAAILQAQIDAGAHQLVQATAIFREGDQGFDPASMSHAFSDQGFLGQLAVSSHH
jgi:hypothetical protein